MNSAAGLFSIAIVLSISWPINCFPQGNIGGMNAEGNTHNDNMGILSEIETEDKTGVSVNGRGDTVSGEDITEVKRLTKMWNNYWKARSAWFDEIRRRGSTNSGSSNGNMMSMGSKLGSRTGMSSLRSTNNKLNNGMSTSVGSNTNGMSMQTGTDNGYINKMDTSMATNSNFNSGMAAAIKNGDSFNSEVAMPLGSSMTYGSLRMPGTDASFSMATGFNSNSQSGLIMGSSTGFSFGSETGSNAGMKANGGIEAGSSNTERSEDGSSASVMSGSSHGIDMSLGSSGMR